MRKVVVFPAYNVGDSELSYSLKSIDPENLLVICPYDFIERNRPKGHFIPDEFIDNEALIAKIRAYLTAHNMTPVGIIGVDEEDQFCIAKDISYALGVEFYEERTIEIASNKLLMKRAFFENHVPSPTFQQISNIRDARINFPNVLKIISGNSSEYLYLNKVRSDLEKNFKALMACVRDAEDTRFGKILRSKDELLDPRKIFLLEEFAKGIEFSCDFLMDERVEIIRIARKTCSRHFGYFSGFHLINDISAAEYGLDTEKLRAVGERIKSALGIRKGVCMCDFTLDQGNISVLETNIRPGLATFIHAMHLAYGFSSMSILARQKLGEKITLAKPEKEALVAQFYGMPGKVIRYSYEFPDWLNDKIIAKYEYYEKGDMITDSESSHHGLLAGYVILADPDRDHVADAINEIEKSAKVITEPNKMKDGANSNRSKHTDRPQQ